MMGAARPASKEKILLLLVLFAVFLFVGSVLFIISRAQ
jgi:preprotein translocase subunit Sss1